MRKRYFIKNLEDFVNSTRTVVYNSFGNNDSSDDISLEISTNDKEEMDRVLSYNEALGIVQQNLKKQRNKKTNTIRYVLSEKIFIEIIESLNQRMISNILGKLCNKGLIESAFDSELNDFVFWVKDENNKT
jgi:hypothetical protein